MSLPWVLNHSALVGGLLLGVGAAGTLFYHRHAIARSVHTVRLRALTEMAERQIVVVTDKKGWEEVAPLLIREASREGAVGFDCEWVQVRGRRRPVALLQLASCSGLCVLVRLSLMKDGIPNSLRAFLKDEKILKVGVGPNEDSNYLADDYNIQVRGCIDLRHLVQRCLTLEPVTAESAPEGQKASQGKKTAGGMGLNALAERYLGRTLDKDWRVRASDWEAKTLTKRQKRYAAEDALVGIHILIAVMDKLWTLESVTTPFLPKPLWQERLKPSVHQACLGLLDVKFTASKRNPDTGSAKGSHIPPNRAKPNTRAYSLRQGPLYHNCQLRAPDDQPLCTIDPKKARWYVAKGLGVLVSEEPLVVRLKFEPAGRPQAELQDGQFYLQERHNLCVVCGKDQSYIRKNVVPHEYRKYFPAILKHHQNHDVVLLCLECHRTSNIRDNILRSQLAEECDAPIGTDKDVKATVDKAKKAVRYAAGALLRSPSSIPEKRIAELQGVVRKYYGVEELTRELLEEAANMEVKIYNEEYQAHGHKVFEVYSKVGIVELEQRWRQHFLSSMKPKHLPECWSVTHNVYKLRLKMARLPLDHPDRHNYKLALVGTEGTIHVPYDPTQDRRRVVQEASESSREVMLNGSPSAEDSEDASESSDKSDIYGKVDEINTDDESN
ncbi:exonuclease 3'-5' domain-containing protein 2-like [Penaeus japonicus]|uniref:exonuclease 3'-5' domain-containing protein 2-like n=1 Tax=Penaeus japonicus TaxID=27405 RepID=UPI001C70F72A|nr:exonuclease 3'-5' domain-containing protein 2-like [Penaeus japonicus]XP_042889316.1 exonuclease 3'-5' domain-containing protein 2-like [Penaeus japonicus]XP_042889325.1 exonuclease 3'-5' domain-containing protein 2-like [Penaeus japonicus]XP_042889331.1 exonuclease 3'-5' domain-containing protein 2-like [Penaeus japonicus]